MSATLVVNIILTVVAIACITGVAISTTRRPKVKCNCGSTTTLGKRTLHYADCAVIREELDR